MYYSCLPDRPTLKMYLDSIIKVILGLTIIVYSIKKKLTQKYHLSLYDQFFNLLF